MRHRGGLLPSSSGSGGWLACSNERIYAAMGAAAVLWIIGLMAFLAYGSSSSPLASHLAIDSPHTHRDLVPHGGGGGGGRVSPPASSSHAHGSHAATGSHAAASHGRGFGLGKLDQIQKGIQEGLHNIFQHDGRQRRSDPAALAASKYALQQSMLPTPAPSPDIYWPPTHASDYIPEFIPSHSSPITSPLGMPIDWSSYASPLASAAADGASGASGTSEQSSGVVDIPAAVPESSEGMTNPAIVVLTYKRRGYLLRTLDALVALPEASRFSLYVSQDGNTPDFSDIPAMYEARGGLTLLNHPRLPLMVFDQSPTAFLAQHYKWVLDLLFFTARHSHVVVMEDDMIVSPDFLSLFIETAALLDTDPSLMCVSSWNDNGMSRLVADNTRLMRTDYFPGLGWMTNARVWAELSPKFPLDQWDHFMRLDTTSRGRDCIIPEVARNRNIGEDGTNMGSNFFAKFLAPVAFNTKPVSFLRDESMEHMRMAQFEADLQRDISAAKILGAWGSAEVAAALAEWEAKGTQAVLPAGESWLILYRQEQFYADKIAEKFQLLTFPRSVHRGVFTLRLGNHLTYFADVKLCPYIPEQYRFKRDPTILVVPAHRAEDCNKACMREKRTCDASYFQLINQCSVLKQHFACIHGCRGGVSGSDVPNYVDNPAKKELTGLCLTTEDVPVCEAAHWSASRLCPCA